MVGVGIGCCCGGSSSCCCSWSSIAFYMQFSQNSNSDYDCTECSPANPFLVTLTMSACADDLTDTTLLGNYLLHYDETFCGPDTFYDSTSTLCGGGFNPTALDPALGIIFDCVSGCGETSFTGPCESCTASDLSDPISSPPYAAYIEYTIRAVAGKFSITGTAPLGCGVVITVLKKYYVALGSSNCADAVLWWVQVDVYYMGVGSLTPGAGECCASYSTPTVWNNCRQGCAGSSAPGNVCGAAFAIATIPHPEWGQIAFSC